MRVLLSGLGLLIVVVIVGLLSTQLLRGNAAVVPARVQTSPGIAFPNNPARLASVPQQVQELANKAAEEATQRVESAEDEAAGKKP